MFSYNNHDEDASLILLIRQGDKKAFTLLYRKYCRYLYALAYKYLKDTDTAQDAVQQVFLKIWEYRDNLRIEINLKNYLYTMTKNYILNYFRYNKEAVMLSYAEAQISQAEEYNIQDIIEQAELTLHLKQAIDHLPPQKRDICLLKVKENITNNEIAERMGLSVNTVKSHYTTAIKLLRNYLNKDL